MAEHAGTCQGTVLRAAGLRFCLAFQDDMNGFWMKVKTAALCGAVTHHGLEGDQHFTGHPS